MRLLVSGTGLVTSVGYDVETTCASIRAGIMRTAELDHIAVSAPDTNQPVAVVGCPVSLLTNGFGNVPRWSVMGHEAFNDLLENSSILNSTNKTNGSNKGSLNNECLNEFWSKTALIFALPDLDSANLEFEGVVNSNNIINIFVGPFVNQLGLPIKRANCFVVSEDNTAVIKACTLVEQLLVKSENAIERAIVIAVDSNIECNTLQWLALQGRLKIADNPVGLMPSEAAAAIMFETETAISNRGGNALARIYAHNTQLEKNNITSEDPNIGEGLTQSIKACLSAVDMDGAFTGMIYSDLNGEEWRAQEYGLARVNISRQILSEKSVENYPATSLGDVGLVHAACSLCMLIESKKRGYAQTGDALILASSAMGTAGCMLVKSL